MCFVARIELAIERLLSLTQPLGQRADAAIVATRRLMEREIEVIQRHCGNTLLIRLRLGSRLPILADMEENKGHRRMDRCRVSLSAFQGVSEIHCQLVGASIKTVAVSVCGTLIVACSHAHWRVCPVTGDDGCLGKGHALTCGCPLSELWTAFESGKGLSEDGKE